MKLTVDTNVLVRAATQDDPVQGPIAQQLVTSADLLAVTLPTLCEFCWVLRGAYRFENVPAGQAELTFRLINFSTVRRMVTVTSGGTVTEYRNAASVFRTQTGFGAGAPNPASLRSQ